MFTKITTWKAICKEKGIDPSLMPDVSKIDAAIGVSTTAWYMACNIVDVINAKDEAEGNPIHEIYLYKNSEGGLSFVSSIRGGGGWRAGSYAGSAARLYFKSRTGAEHAAKYFLQVFIDLRK